MIQCPSDHPRCGSDAEEWGKRLTAHADKNKMSRYGRQVIPGCEKPMVSDLRNRREKNIVFCATIPLAGQLKSMPLSNELFMRV